MMKSEPYMHGLCENAQKSKGLALARVLPDFSDEPDNPLEDFSAVENPSTDFLERFSIDFPKEDPSVEVPLPIDIETLRQEAFEKGEEKQREEMEASFSARLKLIEEAHSTEIDRLREHIANLAEDLERGVESGLKKIETDLSRQIAKILMVFMNERLTQKAVQQFADTIATESIASGKPLTIEGNKELLDFLQQLPNFDKSRYRLRPTNANEIRVFHGKAILSTRLAARLKELRELI
ncbi:MAG: hypothetical protein JSC188_000043 [Candidatus Tokpelaia sp. JSC188]|nr:MAG: hypothetical protein JSC188_000043 [Candidatus Tokpelaia sp. JSC188]